MACVAVLPYLKFSVQGICPVKLCFSPKVSRIQSWRKDYSGCHGVAQLSSCDISKSMGHLTNQYHKETSITCYYSGALVDPDGLSSDWVPIADQLLLMASVCLTYMAGVFPAGKSLLASQRSIFNKNLVAEDAVISGSVNLEANLKFAWDTVKIKLVDSLNAMDHGANLENLSTRLEKQHAKKSSSLCAIAGGPRLRLLLASFQWLRKEVDTISGNPASCLDNTRIVFCEIVRRSLPAISKGWLEEELCSTNRGFEGLTLETSKKLLSTMLAKISGNDYIFQNIIKSGKEDLYIDLVCILGFGSLRQSHCYDYSFFTLHGVSVLEDLIITLADGIASMFLELISVDGTVSNEVNSLGLNLCTFSTRALQRLRNEVALNQWLYQNMEAVVSMFEDRFDLRILQTEVIEEPSNGETEKITWWEKHVLRKSGPVLSPLRFAMISSICVPVKRTKELRVLTGWRYYFSLFLEFADIAMPIIKTLFAKISEAISFFLVCLIGRSLGLIFTGIRQSLRWK